MKVKEKTSVIYLHGLHANKKGIKNTFLRKTFGKVYDPSIDYSDSNVWEDIKTKVIELNPDYIIGSSMGGWFAYTLGNLLGIKTILFNPAITKRSVEPFIPKSDLEGGKPTNHRIILGREDVVIDPIETITTLALRGISDYEFEYTENGHRTPVDVFTNTLLKYCN